jgi:hypothetical protein
LLGPFERHGVEVRIALQLVPPTEVEFQVERMRGAATGAISFPISLWQDALRPFVGAFEIAALLTVERRVSLLHEVALSRL